jgi:hypothetical protein
VLIAVNDMPVGSAYDNPGQTTVIPDLPAEKMSVFVFTNDVIMQITESEQQPPPFSNPQQTEMKLYKGFHTIEPLVPFHAVRFRCPAGQATVTMRLYNSQPAT